MKKNLFLFLSTFVILLSGFNSNSQTSKEDYIRAFNIDYNWGPGGAHRFAAPGLWADANPDTLMKWYEDLGCNVVHSFGVSCNGYAWYKNGIVPEQPGLKYDFLTEMVKIGRKKQMKVFGYFCVGANNKWEEDHPDLCYQMDNQQIPFTTQYLDYLCASIEDAIKKTDMDGIMLDWLYNPGGGRDPLPPLRWIPCEQLMYRELMELPFPGKDKMTPEIELDFRRKAIDRAWKRIRDITKKTKQDCIIWLSAYEVNSKEYAGSSLLKEIDWLMNEAGDITRTASMKGLVGSDTKLITCLANWNKQDPAEVVPAAIKEKVGLYGFTKPVKGPMMLPVDYYLSKSVDSLKGDERNIGVLARAYNNLPYNYVKNIIYKQALPSPQQVQWQNMERTMFVHFAPNTWQGTELDDRSTALNRINPAKLDVNQWIDAAESFGAKMIIFVAKHVGGFCMWQTESTAYSIKNTPYKNGKGDILDELAKACFNRGMRLGVYIYPGDDTWGAYLGGGGKTKDPTKQEGYNKVLRMQWEEVLSRYGNQIHEIWYDGGLVVPLEDIVKKYSPNAIVFQGPFANIRWVGNEKGIAPYPAWNSVKLADAKTGVATGAHGDPDGNVWMPLEVDVTLKDHNWFWSPTNAKNLRNLDQLMEIYYTSVGRGGLLLLNAAPDTTGLIPKEDKKLYKLFGDEINRRFSNCIASTSGKGESIELNLDKVTKVDHVIIQEDILFGERIREYVIEGKKAGEWIEFSRGLSIGYKRIERFNAVMVSAVRIRFPKFSFPPVIKNMSVYFVGDNNAAAIQDKKDEMLVDSKGYDKSGIFKVDLSDFIKMAGQYELVIRNQEDKNLKIISSSLILQGMDTPGFTKIHENGNCNINITAHPSGGKGTIIVTGQVDTEKRQSHQKIKFYLLKK